MTGLFPQLYTARGKKKFGPDIIQKSNIINLSIEIGRIF
jgi:hypothetical protein